MIFADLMSEPDRYLGKEVEVAGILVLVGHEHYLVDSIDTREDKGAGVFLDIPELKRILMSQVPPSGGTK